MSTIYNLNDRVWVELTEEGQRHYDAYVEKEAEKYNLPKRPEPELYHGTHMELQMWDFINIFGDGSPHRNGGPVLFVDNQVVIHDDE